MSKSPKQPAVYHASRRQFCRDGLAAGWGAGWASGLLSGGFLSGGLMSGALSSLPLGAVHARSRQIGDSKITTYSDGVMSLPTSMLFDTEAHPNLKPLLEQGGPEKSGPEKSGPEKSGPEKSGMAGGQVERPLNVTLLERDGRRVLFDAGSGGYFLPNLGKLPAALEAAGIGLASITDVILTHAHPDHIWGVLDDFDEIALPEARFYISQEEWDFWDSASLMGTGLESFAVGAKVRFDALRDRIGFFGFNQEVIPGVEAIDSRGHTPGHASFVIDTGSESVMVVGDALTHPRISFEHYEVMNMADMDGAMAAVSRGRLLERLASERMVLIGYHLPVPGFGRVERMGWGYRYVAD